MILLFSGTGNTKAVASLLSGRLGGDAVRAFTPAELRDPASASFDCAAGERVVWMFPTYSWGIPPVVAAVMKKASFGPGMRSAVHYMVTTCGDDTGLVDRQWRRIMRRRGLDAAGAYSVIMPNTYVLMKGFDVDSPALSQAKVKAAPVRVAEIADAILAGKTGDILDRKSFSWFKTAVIYPWFIRHAMSPGPFHSTAACVGCGACTRACPMANISMSADGTPRWGGSCALCLGCYHICPQHAVAYGHATDGKGQK